MGGKFSWNDTTNDDHLGGLGVMAVNDVAESSFGGTTRQIQSFGRIGLTNAGGIDQVKRNKDFSRGFDNKVKKLNKKGNIEATNGIFHKLSEEMKVSLLTMAKKDASSTCLYDRAALMKQREIKQHKQKLLQQIT